MQFCIIICEPRHVILLVTTPYSSRSKATTQCCRLKIKSQCSTAVKPQCRYDRAADTAVLHCGIAAVLHCGFRSGAVISLIKKVDQYLGSPWWFLQESAHDFIICKLQRTYACVRTNTRALFRSAHIYVLVRALYFFWIYVAAVFEDKRT